jgi:hypothetical protein
LYITLVYTTVFIGLVLYCMEAIVTVIIEFMIITIIIHLGSSGKSCLMYFYTTGDLEFTLLEPILLMIYLKWN